MAADFLVMQVVREQVTPEHGKVWQILGFLRCQSSMEKVNETWVLLYKFAAEFLTSHLQHSYQPASKEVYMINLIFLISHTSSLIMFTSSPKVQSTVNTGKQKPVLFRLFCVCVCFLGRRRGRLFLIPQTGSPFCLSCIQLLTSGCLGSRAEWVCQEEEKTSKVKRISFNKIYR